MPLSADTSFFAPAAVSLARTPDGALLLKSTQTLKPYPHALTGHLLQWASQAPERRFLAERAPNRTWRALAYGEALRSVVKLSQWLLVQELTPERPIAILSENSIEHALLALAAMHVGLPILPISPAYSLQSSDFGKLKSIIRQSTPGLIYVGDYVPYARALAAISPFHDARLVVGRHTQSVPERALSFEQLEGGASPTDVVRAFVRVTEDTVAKVLFTSGSTGEPKGVINTHRMLCSNQQAKAQVWPFLERSPPVLVDWLPWNHTFGGNHNFNLILRNGGTLYIDAGRPVAQRFAATLENLREIAPTLYFNVPRGYDLLVPALRADARLREHFFSRLQLLFYAAASLPEPLWDALIDLSCLTLGHPLPLISAWGSTETAPLATDCHFQADRPGVIGLPVPGCELKLLPLESRYEVRVRGPLVTPGYWRRADLTKEHFDEEGFYLIGDAVRFVSEAAPHEGLLFDGRLSEDFKLSTGTWVHVAPLRLRALSAFAPVAQDVVLTGHDRSEIGALVFLNVAASRALCGKRYADTSVEELAKAPQVQSCIAVGLQELCAQGASSSTRLTRALLLTEPPSIDAGEITDKGYINQRAVLARRQALVEALYSDDQPDVIRLSNTAK
jgi:feruloyl-CoA synthase